KVLKTELVPAVSIGKMKFGPCEVGKPQLIVRAIFLPVAAAGIWPMPPATLTVPCALPPPPPLPPPLLVPHAASAVTPASVTASPPTIRVLNFIVTLLFRVRHNARPLQYLALSS